jgi:hypothetical protein
MQTMRATLIRAAPRRGMCSLHGKAVSWSSRLQSTDAASTVEAKYMGTAVAVKEALWFRELAGDIALEIEGHRTPDSL